MKNTKQTSKKWYKSKVVWVGILTILGGVITGISGELQTGSELTALGIINIILRYMTSQSIN